MLLLSPGGASAATADSRPRADLPGEHELVLRAAPSEQNRVELTASSDGVRQWWTVADMGAVLVAGDGCRPIDAHTAECEAGANSGAVVVLGDMRDTLKTAWAGAPVVFFAPPVLADGGDGDDELTAAGYPGASVLRGGAGDDQLAAGFGGPAFGDSLDGGPGNDRLVGGQMQDRLRGGGGRDELHGGDGSDLLVDADRDGAPGDAGPGPDVLEGGPDNDTVSYAGRTAPVKVNLADGKSDGEAGEGDRVSQVESIVGGRADDELTGNGLANEVDGGGGHNRLHGGSGDDSFMRASGPISCGSGDFDLIYGRDARDFPQPDCERIRTGEEGSSGLAPYPEMRRGRLVYRFSCTPEDEGEESECSVMLRIQDASRRHRLLAYGARETGAWNEARLKARLTRRGRSVVGRRQGVRAVVRLAESGHTPLRWTIRLGRRAR